MEPVFLDDPRSRRAPSVGRAVRRGAGRLRGRGASPAVARAHVARRAAREPGPDAARVPRGRRPRRLHADGGRPVADRRRRAAAHRVEPAGREQQGHVGAVSTRIRRRPARSRRAGREQAVQIDAGVSSRAAEHLFWLGRYAERAESTRAPASGRAVAADRPGRAAGVAAAVPAGLPQPGPARRVRPGGGRRRRRSGRRAGAGRPARGQPVRPPVGAQPRLQRRSDRPRRRRRSRPPLAGQLAPAPAAARARRPRRRGPRWTSTTRSP